ncbi:MAG: hypothetical protein ACJ0GX_01685 [Parasynechococcus sp.]|jgi:hypothetical protein|uniref:hypothetical protein n=1 Tax=Parasynechococcus sp. TaxID=3101203 RepID=UPI000E1987C2|nr:MAG: hypothetical protein DBW83_09730 [Synechococcus sp. MED-G69]
MEERYERLERSRDPRDRRLDQWLETGRQLVDGVAGRRPGQRRPGLDLDSVGRWVGDKVEWLLEEDDDWREPWQENAEPKARRKQPLQAISRRSRQRPMPTAASQPPPTTAPSVAESSAPDDWPDDDLFQVQRWQRYPAQRSSPQGEPQDQPPSPRRGLPRSSRRRA